MSQVQACPPRQCFGCQEEASPGKFFHPMRDAKALKYRR